MLRVCVLDHTATLGGAELSLLRLLDTVQVHAHVVLFTAGPLAERLRSTGHTCEILPMSPELAHASRHASTGRLASTARNALCVLPFVVRLARRLRAHKPDLVHTTSLKADLIGLVAAKLARLPVVWHIHDRIAPDYLPQPAVRLMRLLARVPDAVIVNSLATASTLPGIPTTIAYPGFSPDQVGPRPSERPLPATPTVGLLGRISPTKGQLEFIRAAARVIEVVPDARFRIIGSAMFGQEDYADQVHAEVEALGLSSSVEFTGFVDDPASALDELTLCVHASPTPEPFGQVVVEAMIRGVPVIATSGGGVDEIVSPHEGPDAVGVLVPPYDVDGLAAAILEVLTRPEEARARAERAWVSATQRFPIRETADVVRDVWERVGRGR